MENEVAARETLLHMLNYSTVIYGDSALFFEEEKKRQVLTNQFILHASNHALYSQYAGSKEQFKKIWKSDGILDVPVKKYLDKKAGDQWQTPVNNGKESIGLAAYFDLKDIAVNKTWPLKKLAAAAASLLLITIWAYLAYGGGAEKISAGFKIMHVQENSTVQVSMKVLKNFRDCGDSAAAYFERLDGYLEINNKRLPLAYNPQTGTASFNIPYQQYQAGSGQVQFSWAINKTVTSKLDFFQKRLPDSVTIRCLDIAKIARQPLNVRYNDTAGFRSLEADLSNALFRYALSPEQADFTDSSRIVYYEQNQKPRADSIVKTIGRKLNINVKEEFIQEIRTPAATPVLFLNTATPRNEPDTNTNSKGYDADFYHGMGDNYFMKKQYRKAIEQYAQAVKLNPKDALAAYQQGICYEMMGDAYAEKALAQYNAAIRINPGDASYYYRRASVQYGLKRYAPAINDYSKVIAMNPANAKTQYLSSVYFRGKSKYFLNNLAGACDDFKKAADAGYTAGKKDYETYCGVPAKTGNDFPDYPNTQQQRTTSFGFIDYDPKGYPNPAGLQLIEKLSGLLKKQRGGQVRLSASYNSAAEQQALEAYMKVIINLFSKNGVDAEARIVQQLNQTVQVQQNRINAPAVRNLNIQVTGINLEEEAKQSKD